MRETVGMHGTYRGIDVSGGYSLFKSSDDDDWLLAMAPHEWFSVAWGLHLHRVIKGES